MKRKDLEQLFDDMSSPSSSKSRRLDASLIGATNEDQSNAIQVFDQSPQQNRPLKRKDLEEAFHDMSSNFSKSRRLDADLFSSVAQGQSGGIEALEQRACPSEMLEGGLAMEPLALSEENVRALVLYNPNNTFYKTPASSDFSIIVNSDLIPGLRDHIFSQGSSKWAKALEAEQSNRVDTNGCTAIVPWVESTWPPSPRREAQAASVLEPMQAEEVEMMDTDDIGTDSFKPSQAGVMMDGSFELQRWQQQQHQQQQQQQLHCLQPQLLNSINTCTPITW